MDGEDAASQVAAAESPPSGPQRRRRAPRAPAAKRPPPVPRFEHLGELPVNDPLAMNEYVHRALGIAAAQVVREPTLSDKERRAELCNIASRMAALTPQSRLFGAEQVVHGDHQALIQGAGPQMEPADGAAQEGGRGEAGGQPARRGRPRKRSIR